MNNYNLKGRAMHFTSLACFLFVVMIANIFSPNCSIPIILCDVLIFLLESFFAFLSWKDYFREKKHLLHQNNTINYIRFNIKKPR